MRAALFARSIIWLSFLFSVASVAAPVVTWSPASVTEKVLVGKTTTLSVSFIASSALNNVVVRVVPELQPFVQAEPSALGNIAKGQKVNLNIIISAPLDSPQETVEGTIQLRSGSDPNKVFAKPLPVTITIFGAVIGTEGGTVSGPDGSSVTLQPGAIDYEVVLGIEPTSSSEIVAPLGALALVSAVKITFDPIDFNASLLPPSAPLQISTPIPAGTPIDERFIVGQQVLSDFISEGKTDLREQLVAVDTAAVAGGDLVTEANIFPGVFDGGLFAFLSASGSGFATGIVKDASGSRPGVVVSNNTNTLVSVTNEAGQYTLFISGGPFTVTGFDPLRGSRGSASGTITTPDSTVTADISLSPLDAPAITRDGIRNGGFERGNLSSWATAGAANAVQQLGPTSTGVAITPREGGWMADINTGTDAIGGVGSSLKQRFKVPAGVRTLRLDFNFVSEEFPEFVGSIFDDSFRAIVTTLDEQSTFAQVSVNNSGGFTLIGDCGFPGGDSTCGQTDWREGSVNLSAFAGTNQMIEVELLFSAEDAGDNIFDTHVLVDNIRFSTLWISPKIITGASANDGNVFTNVLQATEILSQAGINVRFRAPQTIADPGGLLDVTIRGSANELGNLLALSRSGISTDVNLYYVRSLINEQGDSIARGVARCTQDCPSGITNWGVALADARGSGTTAHELGHIIINDPQNGDGPLEHGSESGNFMNSPSPSLGSVPTLLTREQSANINRVDARLLLP